MTDLRAKHETFFLLEKTNLYQLNAFSLRNFEF